MHERFRTAQRHDTIDNETSNFEAPLSTLFASGAAWQNGVARQQAATAIRDDGRNMDFDALNHASAVAVLLPVTVLFGAAAVVGARR